MYKDGRCSKVWGIRHLCGEYVSLEQHFVGHFGNIKINNAQVPGLACTYF